MRGVDKGRGDLDGLWAAYGFREMNMVGKGH
jgi:hypothetical protein